MTDIRTALLELQRDVHTVVEEHGFHGLGRTLGDEISLMHRELSEATEAFSKYGDETLIWTGDDGKPEGVASELADTILRILDTAQEREIPVIDELFAKLEYNRGRPHLHGGKHL
jgi:NTP pyrophosphatase (non-canonical NTP hydrolase)